MTKDDTRQFQIERANLIDHLSAARRNISGIMPLTPFGEQVVEALGPSNATPVWNCGHPRTPENTQRVGVAGDRCRKCRNEMHARLRQEGRA